MATDITEDGAAFDYAVLADDIATAARDAASRIRERVRSQQIAIFDIGRDLLAMKQVLGHGHFLGWIEAEFGMTARTAQNYMGAADAFGDKCETVSHLPARIIYALSTPAIPASIREEVVSRGDAGAPIAVAEIEERIRVAREAARDLKQDAKRTPNQKAYQRKIAKTVEQEERERQKRVTERDALVEQSVRLLVERLGEDLPVFVALYKKVDSWYFHQALEAAVSKS